MDLTELRNDFPILKRPLIFFDNAATTHKPQQVIDAVVDFYTHNNAPIHRSICDLAEQATALYEKVRATVARFINAASADEIVFTSGTTQGINLVAHSWAQNNLTSGDEIIVSELEHHANLLPWQRVAQQTGAVLKFIPVLADGIFDMAAYTKLLSPKTKLIAVTHVSNALGTEVAIATIIKEAHAVGARVLIDAAQSVPHQRIDVQKLDCDFLVFSGHKIMGPTGIGVLYIKKELHDQLVPYQLGGGMVFAAEFDKATWRAMPHMLEAGSPPVAQVVGLGAAIDYLNEHVDFAQVRAHEASLCTRLIAGLQKLPQIKILGPVEQLKQSGHLVSFIVDGVHAHDVAAYLSAQGICVRAGHHCAQPVAKKMGYTASVRVSFYFYNTVDEVDRLLAALNKLLN